MWMPLDSKSVNWKDILVIYVDDDIEPWNDLERFLSNWK